MIKIEFLIIKGVRKMIEPNTKRTPKEKAIKYIYSVEQGIKDDYPIIERKQIEKAIDIALEEHAIQLFNDLDNVRITNDSFGEPHIILKTCIDYIEKKKKWLK